MKPVKVAIMSCSHGHARGYYSLIYNPRFELVAVSIEKGYEERAFLDRLPNIPVFEDDEKMLDSHPEIEAVIMASANFRHIDQMRLCAKKGIHVLSMKIPTFDMQEYDEMIKLVEESNIVCQMELELRYSPQIHRIRELYNSGRLGQVFSFNATNTSHNPMWWLPWMGIPEESYGKKIELRKGFGKYRGGGLADHPHIFDLIRYIFNSDFECVYTEIAPNIRKDIPIEDIVFITGKLKNGIIFSLDPSYSRTENRMPLIGAGWEQYPKRVEVDVKLCGEKATVVSDVYGNYIYHNAPPNNNYVARGATGHPGCCHFIVEEFYECIRNGRKPTVTIQEHKKTIQAVNACYESFYKGEVVYL